MTNQVPLEWRDTSPSFGTSLKKMGEKSVSIHKLLKLRLQLFVERSELYRRLAKQPMGMKACLVRSLGDFYTSSTKESS